MSEKAEQNDALLARYLTWIVDFYLADCTLYARGLMDTRTLANGGPGSTMLGHPNGWVTLKEYDDDELHGRLCGYQLWLCRLRESGAYDGPTELTYHRSGHHLPGYE